MSYTTVQVQRQFGCAGGRSLGSTTQLPPLGYAALNAPPSKATTLPCNGSQIWHTSNDAVIHWRPAR